MLVKALIRIDDVFLDGLELYVRANSFVVNTIVIHDEGRLEHLFRGERESRGGIDVVRLFLLVSVLGAAIVVTVVVAFHGIAVDISLGTLFGMNGITFGDIRNGLLLLGVVVVSAFGSRRVVDVPAAFVVVAVVLAPSHSFLLDEFAAVSVHAAVFVFSRWQRSTRKTTRWIAWTNGDVAVVVVATSAVVGGRRHDRENGD